MISTANITMQFGAKPLFENISVKFGDGNRYGLIGANGCGKSTFMKILSGGLTASSGNVSIGPNERVGVLHQDQFAFEQYSVVDTVIMGHGQLWEIKQERDRIYGLPDMSEDDGMRVAELETQFAEMDGYTAESRAEEILMGAGIEQALHYGPMSDVAPGWKLRVLLAQALFSDPDILLLDEPTNHLDLDGILWLEQCVMSFQGCVLFVTHDRALIEKLATRIIELDRGILTNYDTNYVRYLELREHALEVEAEQNALFDKRLAQEEVWIRQGIKARRTRNEGRVRALEKMRNERSQRRVITGSASLSVNQGDKTGKVVAELTDVTFEVPGKMLVDNLSLLICRGDKLALIGPNGAGKTTLLRLILGELAPQSGTVKAGTKLQVAYFDQLRDRLDEDKRVVDIVGQGRDSVTINGKDRHIMSYLGDFLFTPERARSHFGVLSGGERARVQLACLFSQPANVLVMDEPTNDLDMETLELLESLLVEFSGTVLLVSHDRSFVDSVASSCLLFEGNGQISEHVGGYTEVSNYMARRASQQKHVLQSKESVKADVAVAEVKPTPKVRKLSYKDQRELDALPEKIESLEAKIAELGEVTGDPAFYQQDADKVTQVLELLSNAQLELDACMERWMELAE